MEQYHNKKEVNKIGANIRKLRKKAGLSLDDVAQMTGFAQSHLSAIEKGSDTGTSHLIEIAKAIGVPPMELFNVPFTLKPRFPLSPNRDNRSQLTHRLTVLVDETNFFNTPRFVRDVVAQFKEQYKVQVLSSIVSGTLNRLVNSGKLNYSIVGRQRRYFKKK